MMDMNNNLLISQSEYFHFKFLKCFSIWRHPLKKVESIFFAYPIYKALNQTNFWNFSPETPIYDDLIGNWK